MLKIGEIVCASPNTDIDYINLNLFDQMSNFYLMHQQSGFLQHQLLIIYHNHSQLYKHCIMQYLREEINQTQACLIQKLAQQYFPQTIPDVRVFPTSIPRINQIINITVIKILSEGLFVFPSLYITYIYIFIYCIYTILLNAHQDFLQ
ncbi:hypothetical protein FGO68_gene10185 [Halteria grandinella]|uniref:Transmembrane protein n=1 Tax=Halteria grandinella TaxID=5974 RepID=A0A8J8T1S2_HALGN|nr:hypothetical protein FGO68_gene10185 [Halteria grandinella]